MRFTHDDLREALNHKDWLEHLTSALTLEETKTEEGPATQASLHGLPNVVSRSAVLERVEVTRVRVAVGLGLIPVEALASPFDEEELEELRPVDLAALRLREAILGPGESADANQAKLIERLEWSRKIDRVNTRLAADNAEAEQSGDSAASENDSSETPLPQDQTPQIAENPAPEASGESGSSV
jgi:hypothetical protein